MTIQEYEAEAINDFQIDITKFTEYNLSIGLKKVKWSTYLYNEERVKDNYEECLAELYKKRFHYYMYEVNEKIEKKNIGIYVEGDEEYIKGAKAYKAQVAKTKFIENILKNLENQSFVCNIVLKHLMWQNPDNPVKYSI